MSSDRFVTGIAVLVLMAHGAALLWLLQPRRRLAPLLAVNMAVAAGVLAYQGQRIRIITAGPGDPQLLGLIAFEALAFTLSAWAFTGRRAPVVAACIAFGVHLCAAAVALVFLMTFKMTRLF